MDSDEQYFCFENRLASFRSPQPVAKSRVSTAASRAPKALVWPHKTLSPVALAKAGFFFEPHPKSPDNVVCFLCEKSLDGWEETDNPLEEHLKHSPTCGWAIMAAIEAGFGNYGKVHPLDPAMIEARKATFAGRWPYESKKGFKCKTKKFFTLINQNPAPKKGRAKAARTSKASRLSVQSVATVATTASDLVSAADITGDHDDSAMTTASTMTQGGKKTAKGRKATTAKGRKPRAKKDEVVEILEDEPEAQAPPKKTASRGRKRASDAMEDPDAANAEAPAPKKRAPRVRASAAADNSSVPDAEMADAIPLKQPAGKKKARASTAKTARKTSQASVKSQASTTSLHAELPDDDELERQLEADLERYQSDVDEMTAEPAPAPARGRPKKAATARKTSSQKQKVLSESYAMFDPTPMVPDEAEIEADLDALQAEMAAKQPPVETLVVPKKGRKAGTRKASKQTKKVEELVPQSDPLVAEEEPIPERSETPAEELPQAQQELEPELRDDSNLSTGTVVTKPIGRPALRSGRGRPSKKSTASQASVEEQEQLLSAGIEQQTDLQPAAPRPRESSSAPKSTSAKVPRKPVPAVAEVQPPAAATPPAKTAKSLPAPPQSASRLPQPPSTPRSRPGLSPSTTTTRPYQPILSPAETLHRSLQPAASLVAARVPLAPVPAPAQAQTPNRSSSPAKRNTVGGLQSQIPWHPADLDMLFSSSPTQHHQQQRGDADDDEDKENAAVGGNWCGACCARAGC
ncbi:hypothetical protein NEMBOFW57_006854 [Staphylotrichum longicolle]|uniref:BIR-domain-containing protein n=1 Tax=Staphylotrichum longicolle TaxID=669026 RepID=A0AAD4HUS9_9PEZI|nr:hypothetical protein NEMBOFW57_006854 [Staphylotrichum longicolle]